MNGGGIDLGQVDGHPCELAARRLAEFGARRAPGRPGGARGAEPLRAHTAASSGSASPDGMFGAGAGMFFLIALVRSGGACSARPRPAPVGSRVSSPCWSSSMQRAASDGIFSSRADAAQRADRASGTGRGRLGRGDRVRAARAASDRRARVAVRGEHRAGREWPRPCRGDRRRRTVRPSTPAIVTVLDEERSAIGCDAVIACSVAVGWTSIAGGDPWKPSRLPRCFRCAGRSRCRDWIDRSQALTRRSVARDAGGPEPAGRDRTWWSPEPAQWAPAPIAAETLRSWPGACWTFDDAMIDCGSVNPHRNDGSLIAGTPQAPIGTNPGAASRSPLRRG